MDRVIIIVNGLAGITAARHIRKQSDFDISVISGESDHFWSRTALMYIYMGHMKFEHTKPYEDHFWQKNRIELINDHVTAIDPSGKKVLLKSEKTLSYDHLILATGSRHNVFNWEGVGLDGITGMVSLQDLERIEEYTQNISRGVIVGGGLIGIELAEMLRSRNIDVTFLVREKEFWHNVLPEQEAAMISRHIRDHGVDLRLSTELKGFRGDASGRVTAAITASGEEITCQFAGLTAGVHPNIDLASGTVIETDQGFLVDRFLRTSVNNIYAIGDCAQLRQPSPGRRAIEPVWYTGRMMGETVALTITGEETPYTPGPWFNSAKFFDIEYQTYGNVLPECPENESDFFWKHPTEDRAVHLRFLRSGNLLTGINTFGIRMRHDHFDQWLRQGADIREVLQQLESANFDPEFFEDDSASIREAFNENFPALAVDVSRKRRKILGIF